MVTKIVKVDEHNIDKEQMEAAGRIIREGGLVAFPTETVYGLGGDALNPDSSAKIYEAKGRPSDNPLIVHIADMESLNDIVSYIPETAKKLTETFWPGPLTIVFPKSDAVPLKTTGGLDTVAVRMPVHEVAREFIRAAGGYVAAPSANRSGRPSPTLAKYVREDMEGVIDMIIDSGDVEIGLESTIVDVTSNIPVILRPGFITKEMLEDVLGEVAEDATMMRADSGQAPKAPGMKYKHYAPKGELFIVKGEPQKVTTYINEEVKKHQINAKKTGVIGTDETRKLYKADVVKSAGRRDEQNAVASNLYRILREFDDESVEIMYSESFDGNGLSQAIMNRLLKAAGHKVIEVQ